MRRRLVAVLLMVLATRLLMASGGAGAFTPPLWPPTTRTWTRSAGNPILSPVLAWEETAVSEPSVLQDGGTLKMWYSGGWANPAIGYATSTDGSTWTKYASNPVYGKGGSGVAGNVASCFVLKNGSTYYLYGSGGSPLRSTFAVATSTDGIAWTNQAHSISFPAGMSLWGNHTVWIEGSTWYLWQEAGPGGEPWMPYLYTSTDGLTWSIANGGSPLSGLQRGTGLTTAVPNTVPSPIIPGRYDAWFHAAFAAGNPNDQIFHAHSTDKLNWTMVSGVPELSAAGGAEGTSVGDPSPLNLGGTTYLYYDGGDPVSSPAYIFLATSPTP
jgi:hypothetical protein